MQPPGLRSSVAAPMSDHVGRRSRVRGEEQMGLSLRSLTYRGAAVGAGVLGTFVLAAGAHAATLQVSSDPFTQNTCKASATTNHQTEVEPDTFANGSTIVSAFQVGRIYDGGACAIGF